MNAVAVQRRCTTGPGNLRGSGRRREGGSGHRVDHTAVVNSVHTDVDGGIFDRADRALVSKRVTGGDRCRSTLVAVVDTGVTGDGTVIHCGDRTAVVEYRVNVRSRRGGNGDVGIL